MNFAFIRRLSTKKFKDLKYFKTLSTVLFKLRKIVSITCMMLRYLKMISIPYFVLTFKIGVCQLNLGYAQVFAIMVLNFCFLQ